MLELIYKKAVEPNDNGDLLLKDFRCIVELVDSVSIKLSLYDLETSESKEESIELSEAIDNIGSLKSYLLSRKFFYEPVDVSIQITQWKKDNYASLREVAYPSWKEFADAYVKDDVVGMQAYKDKCLAVKVKYLK